MNIQRLRNKAFIMKLLENGAEIYMVGGNVRDKLMNRDIKDNDLLIRLLPFKKLKSILEDFGVVNIVGQHFGVIKFREKNDFDNEYDISLPRLEKSTGAGHQDFEVDFNPDLKIEIDLSRRDFTINAMAINLKTEELMDPFNGKSDLQNKILRQVSNESFKEDPLRMLRGIQFAARFGLDIDEATKVSMEKNAKLIKHISRERIIEEIKKLMMAPKPSQGFDIMRDTKIMDEIFPFMRKMIGVLQPMKRNQDVYDHTMTVVDAARNANEIERPGNLELMFAALFHDVGKPKTYRFDEEKQRVTFFGHQNVSRGIARHWMNDYRITTIGVDPKKVLNLVENHMFETKFFYTDKAIRRFINKVGIDNIFDLIDLRIADKKGGKFPDKVRGILQLREKIRDEINKKPPFGPKDLKINGHDLMDMGYTEGPILGKIMHFLVDKVLDEPELNEKEILEKIVRENFKN